MLPEITQVIASLIANPPGGAKSIPVKKAVGLALATRPLRYGLSTEYALRRYRAIRRGSVRMARGETASLWEEFVRKVDDRLANHPSEDDFTAVEHILSNDSPSRYFLTPLYAEKLFYRRLPLPSSGHRFIRKRHTRP